LQLKSCGHSSYVTSSLKKMGLSLMNMLGLSSRVLLKILPCAVYTSPLSVLSLQSKSCLSYLSYATTAA
jgi:hypothetical protein